MNRALRALPLRRLWQRDLRLVFILTYRNVTPAPDRAAAPRRRSVAPGTFRRQIRLLSRLGRFVSLDDVRDGRGLSKINFVVTFDGVSRTAKPAFSFLEARAIPFALCPFAASAAPGEGATTAVAAADRLSLEEIRRVLQPSRLATLVNHGEQDCEAGRPTRELVIEDARRSTEACERCLGFRPRYYAVPFRAPLQSLALDLQEVLRGLGYHGVLWEHDGCNLIRDRFKGRLMNVTRLEAPATTPGLVRMLARGARQAHASLLELLPAAEEAEAWSIEMGQAPDRALAFENVMREARDYASDPDFYRYLFSHNPYKGIRPDYYAVSSNGRITSIGYNFHIRFVLDASPVDGVYWSGWRKLPGSNRAASALLLMKALSAEQVVGAYQPSPIAAEALRSKAWKRIQVSVCTLNVRSAVWHVPGPITGGEVREYATYPSSLDELTTSVTRRFRFSIARSPEFYRWRYDRYPLGETRYFELREGDRPTAYFVTIRNAHQMSISDFYCSSVQAFAALLRRALAFGRSVGVHTVIVETSLPDIERFLRGLAAQISFSRNYYHFSRTFSASQSARGLLEEWDTVEFHETQACGDVLLR